MSINYTRTIRRERVRRVKVDDLYGIYDVSQVLLYWRQNIHELKSVRPDRSEIGRPHYTRYSVFVGSSSQDVSGSNKQMRFRA